MSDVFGPFTRAAMAEISRSALVPATRSLFAEHARVVSITAEVIRAAAIAAYGTPDARPALTVIRGGKAT